MAGLYVHRSNRVENLGVVLAKQLGIAGVAPGVGGPAGGRERGDPVRPVTVVVGSRGMERWLRHVLAQQLGICANVRFCFPAQVLSELVDEVLGDAPEGDPWAPDALAWAVLDVLPDLLERGEFAPVLRYLGGAATPVDHRRYGFARAIADRLDGYVHDRPDWVAAWGAGHQPPALREVAAARWQAQLWRQLEARFGRTCFAARAAAVEARLRDGTAGAPSLDRVHVFGVSSLAPASLALLSLLSERVAVDLYLMCPSDAFWGELRTAREARRDLRSASRAEIVDEIRAALAVQNPLLTSSGRVSRDFQLVLEGLPGGYHDVPLFGEPLESAPTMLARLQSDVLHLRAPDALGVAPEVAPHDDSVRVHACHGPTRQVEVLREALLGLFDDHPHLEPRDVVVMTPDVETYAPLVSAVFAQGRDRPRADGWGPVGAPRIPFELADLGLRAQNPVADALLRVLELAGARVTATAVMDLLALEPVRARFGVEADDLPDLREQVAASGVRWAVDEADRARADQPRQRANTWGFGLDRLALGVVMPDDGGLFAGVSPYDDMEGGDAARFGRFADFCAALFAAREALGPARSVAAWVEALRELVDGLTLSAGKAGWLREQVLTELAGLEGEAAQADFTGPVTLDALRRALSGRFEVSRHGDRQVTGSVTVCALSPMRSVPFRVVCLLGLDDGVFPRGGGGLGFDLVQAFPRVGDRDPRDEDRHLFLEALLSAREHLLILYTGRDVRTNEARPPAVPVAELVEVIEATFGEAARARVVVQHPLQPFSPECFGPEPTSFDRRMCAAAERLRAPRGASAGLFADGPVPAPEIAQVDLDELAEFVRRPVRQLLQRRLGLYLRDDGSALADREPIALDALEAWVMADGLLGFAVRWLDAHPGQPVDWEAVERRTVARGELPLGAAGRRVLQGRRALAEAVIAGASEALGLPARHVPIDLEVGGVRLVGTVRDLRGDALLDLGADAPDKPRRLLRAWVRLLALRVAEPDTPIRAQLVGVARGASKVAELVAPADAEDRLSELVALFRAGATAPLPLFEKASHALASALGGDGWDAADPEIRRKALQAALGAWQDGEGGDAAHAAVWPEDVPLVADGGADPEFVALAERVWGPLLASRSDP